LVPDELKKVFDTLNQVISGISYKQPKNLKKGSGKKGHDGNPASKDRKPPPKAGVQKPKRKKCNVKKSQSTTRLGKAKNTLRIQSCSGDVTRATDTIVVEATWGAGVVPTAVPITRICDHNLAPQACYHYSSAIDVNPQWKTLACPHTTTRYRLDGSRTKTWQAQHTAAG
jgi:hypothetical protein